ncbi:MAG: DUF1552 domain-containing protein [Steroidobacteraceae bacterium]
MYHKFTRRQVLRGAVNGVGVTVALPFLNCFLNTNGTALASGAPIPVRFGSWVWGLGTASPVFRQKLSGTDYVLKDDGEELMPVKHLINVLGGFDIIPEGRPQICHQTGWIALRTGVVPVVAYALPNESLDVSIADVIGKTTRFRSLDLTCTGNDRTSFSFRSADAVNPPEISPARLYARIFGPEFQDPNSPTFTPNPRLMVRKSVLSGVREDSASLLRGVGSEDRARLDQYFTAIREVEQRLELQLQKPPPAAACKKPTPPANDPVAGLDVEVVRQRHEAMTQILALALACNQTRVFNLAYSDGLANTTRPGLEKTHHTITHEEPTDETLAYQKQHSWFARRALKSFAYFVNTLQDVKEGDGTLLDNCAVFAHSDHEIAKAHSYPNIPMMTVGRAGGRLKTGLYVHGGNTPATRVGLTFQRLMGVPVDTWGKDAMRTSSEVAEILTASTEPIPQQQKKSVS